MDEWGWARMDGGRGGYIYTWGKRAGMEVEGAGIWGQGVGMKEQGWVKERIGVRRGCDQTNSLVIRLCLNQLIGDLFTPQPTSW